MKEGAALVALLLVATLAAEAQNASIWSGVFTAEQAKRGNDAYQASCAACHGSDLHATDPEAADLTGPAIRAKWNGKTLQDRFETIRDTMPPGNAIPIKPLLSTFRPVTAASPHARSLDGFSCSSPRKNK